MPVPVRRHAALLNVDALLAAFEDLLPDPSNPAQCVHFGTSGHRGCAFERSFNRAHVIAITQAICDVRRMIGITGPMFVAIDTHAVSAPACATALRVLQANDVQACVAPPGGYTPTPVLSHAILRHNASGSTRLADGIALTPSHNPPRDGGYKYNLPHGGAADTAITERIEQIANGHLRSELRAVRALHAGGPYAHAHCAALIHDFMQPYVDDLPAVLDMPLLSSAGLEIAVDCMGGAGLQYWPRIAAQHHLRLHLFNATVDPQFAFMPPDWDGQIRMDPASTDAMQTLIARAPAFDLAIACDTDHDRHGIVSPQGTLIPANHYLAAAADYLFGHRSDWPQGAGIGKSMVTTRLLERIAQQRGLRLLDMPVGFKWFVRGLTNGALAFAGEESAGATFLRRNGQVWTTDKDGMVAGLLAAEITAHDKAPPDHRHLQLTRRLGGAFEGRRAVPATAAQRARIRALHAAQLATLPGAGPPPLRVLTEAPGNGQPFDGVRIDLPDGWFALRPSGTEALVRIYAESQSDATDLLHLLARATRIAECFGSF